MSVVQKLKEAQAKRNAQLVDARNRANEKARYVMLFQQREIEAKAEAERRKAEETVKAEKALAAKQAAELEAKTHKYYGMNNYHRKTNVDGLPMYFGDTERILPKNPITSAWIPEGYGEFYYDGSVQYEGEFKKGLLFGEGKFNFDDDSNYVGQFYKGDMHGSGLMVTKKGRANVLMRDNIVMCSKDGKQIEFDDKTLGVYTVGSSVTDGSMKQRTGKGSIKSYESQDGVVLSNAGRSAIAVSIPSLVQSSSVNRAKGTIIRNVYDWRYLIRFDNEVYPKQREIDLSRLNSFKVCHHLPLIYHLDNYTNSIGGCVKSEEELEAEKSAKLASKSALHLPSEDSDIESEDGKESRLKRMNSEKRFNNSGKRFTLNSEEAHKNLSYNTSRNYHSNSKVDPGISYDYYADTFGLVSKQNPTENMMYAVLTNSEINNRDTQSRGKVNYDDMVHESNEKAEITMGLKALTPASDSFSASLPKVSNARIEKQLDLEEELARITSMSGSFRKTFDRRIVGVKPLKPSERYTSDYRENLFETRLIGIGVAEELEQERIRAELKKQQWSQLVSEKRKKLEEERMKEIAAEQERMLSEGLKEQQQVAAKKKEEEARYQEELQKSVMETNLKFQMK